MGPTSRELLPQNEQVVTRRPRNPPPPPPGLLPPPEPPPPDPPPGGCCPPPPPPAPEPPPPLPVRLLLAIRDSPFVRTWAASARARPRDCNRPGRQGFPSRARPSVPSP